MDMIDGDKLNQAINNTAHKRFNAELREAIVYGPLILNEIYGQYIKLMDNKQTPPETTSTKIVKHIIRKIEREATVAYENGEFETWATLSALSLSILDDFNMEIKDSDIALD